MRENRLQPLDIAREALRRLAVERIAPTPDNYRTRYHEIAGTDADDAFPESTLRQIASSLPRDTPERLKLAHQFEHAVETHNWAGLRQGILAIYTTSAPTPPEWAPLLRQTLTLLDLPHKGQTRAQKLQALGHILSTGGAEERMHARLQSLLRNWERDEIAPNGVEVADQETGSGPVDRPAGAATAAIRDSIAAVAAPTGAHSLPADFAAWFAHLLRKGVMPLVADDARLVHEAGRLAAALDEGSSDHEVGERLKAFATRLEWAGEDQRAVREALFKLLRLIVSNIGELVINDSWIKGQIEVLDEVFARPLDIRMLDEVERRLQAVIEKQGRLKRELSGAQARLEHMLSAFVDRLSDFCDSTDHYEDSLDRAAVAIGGARDLAELADAVQAILRETREVQASTRRSNDEISALRAEVDSANQLINRLQRELAATSEQARNDPLTGVLNRTGISEAFDREIALARQRSTELCIALLDIDNFKHFNDEHGHRVGDDALRHLASVVRESLRPQDSLGRLGGEEFLILLPDTRESEAADVVRRLQRELTRRFFLANNRRLLITFSAGIARIERDEAIPDALDRADKAMYAAKRAGKNRVLVSA